MDSFPNARTGIQLAQAGRRSEALGYLRRSVQMEDANTEVWLWLAHVTSDLREYEYCMQQALALDPNHAIARQMQQALYQHFPQPASPILPSTRPPRAGSTESQPMVVDASLIQSMEQQSRTRGRRRLLLAIVVLVVVTGAAAIAGSLLGEQESTTSDAEESGGKIAQVVVRGNSRQTFRFELIVPTTWLLADTSSSMWNDVREGLIEASNGNGQTVWEQVETDISAVTVDPETGSVQPPMTLIEADLEAVERDRHTPARLQLVRITSAGTDGTSCEGMHALAERQEAELEEIEAEQQSVIGHGVEEPVAGQCVFVIHFRDRSPLSRMIEHIYVIQVPASARMVAEWHLTVIDDAHEVYESVIERIIDTLRVIEP